MGKKEEKALQYTYTLYALAVFTFKLLLLTYTCFYCLISVFFCENWVPFEL